VPAACNGMVRGEVGTSMLPAAAGTRSLRVVVGNRPQEVEAQRIEQVGSTCMPVAVWEHRDRTIAITLSA
jgi:hypothetical protein